MLTLQEREQHLLLRLSKHSSWEEKYKAIIGMGNDLEIFPDSKRNEDYKIKGCQSQVWLWVEPDESKKMRLTADSDALITKGLVAVIVYLYSGATPSEITGHSLDIFKKLGLFEHLSPSRANGLANMIKQVKNYAFAYQVKGY